MNTNLSLRIIDYLNQKTNYAVIISGRYGIGKTYYLENILFPEIKKIKKETDEKEEKYKTIRISLFGLASIDELEKLIFLETYPLLKNKGVQIFGGILKGAAKYAKIDLDKILEDSGLTPGEINNYENFVICFDDIDRKSPTLELSEFYGFINNLVENKSAKIILIANEDILRKEVNRDQIDNYSVLREKVIGITFPFTSDIEDIINNLIENYKGNTDYYDFLNTHSSYIVSMVKAKDDNLRNVIFFLEHYKNIFKQSNIVISENENLEKIKSDVLIDILKFTLPLTFEYKLGKLNDENLNLLKKHLSGELFSLSLFGNQEENKNKGYLEEFIEQYGETNSRTVNFPSILEYIIGNNIIDKEQLLSEFQEIYKINSDNFTEKELIFNKLRYWNCVDLTATEYKEETRKLLNLVYEDKISLDEFPSIFHFISRFENPLNLNIEKLKNKFIRKIIKGNHQYINNIGFRLLIDPNEIYTTEIREVITACINKNNELAIIQEQTTLDEIFNKFENNYDVFIEDSQNTNSEFLYKPFFSTFQFNKFWRIINKLSNTKLIELGFLIEHRYRPTIYPDLLKEKDFLLELKQKLELKLNSKKCTKLDIATYKNVIGKIEKVIPNF